MKCIKLVPVFLVCVLLSGCTGCNKNKSREKPDVSNINIDMHVQRFDQDLLGFNSHHFDEWDQTMNDKYGEFYRFYVSNFIVGPRAPGDTTNVNRDATLQFLNNHYIKTIQDSINTRFGKFEDVERDLKQAFTYTKHYMPKWVVPGVITINSGFGAGVSPFGAEKMVIGLDMFLGADNKDYDSAGVYMYLRHKMRREYIARYAVEAIYENSFAPLNVPDDQPLIEAMVDRGKKIYFISYVLPDAPDSMLLGFTNTQTQWCYGSEYEIWKFLNDHDLLYKTNAMEKMRYLNEGPTTNGMPPESPGNMANFIGYQVVKKFMSEAGGNIGMEDLLTKYDAKTILAKAKYRPAK